jgi:hypothetical protein
LIQILKFKINTAKIIFATHLLKGEYMKQLVKYQCEICKDLFDSPENASLCEVQGIPEILAKVGDRISYRDDWNGGYSTCYDEMDVIEITVNGHYVSYQLGDLETGYPCVSVWGNEEFLDKCKIINLETVENTIL